MTTMHISDLFQKTMIATIVGLCISQSSIALEVLSDESLGDTTGEGIAFFPQDFYFVYRGAGANESKASLFSDRSKDTGYIHIIPVGPLTETALDTNKDGRVDGNDHSVGKADIYVYGLALSKSDNDSNSRLAKSESAAMLRNWGTPENPWVIKAQSETGVPNFSGTPCDGPQDGNCHATFMGLEAPLLENGAPWEDDANRLKLAFWSDAFVLDQNKRPDSPQLYHLGAKMGTSDAGRANRLRTQVIWNNFSINGSKLQVFKTMGYAHNGDGLSAFYGDTLGLAGLIRLNSGDPNNLNASRANNNILRISTREYGSENILQTPAVHGTNAPNFNTYDGFIVQNLNLNLVLGSLFQPVIIGSDGKNFSLELARIVNKAEIYNKLYIDYDNINSSTYKGSVCNFYRCGSNSRGKYQGNNATHSSITFGKTNYDANKNSLTANTDSNPVGINWEIPWVENNSKLNPNSINLGSGVIDGVLIQHLKITSKGL